jgi:DNA-binding MarR family transcriptional regulator
MPSATTTRRSGATLRTYRNNRLYRPLGRVWRVYNRLLIARLQARGFADFTPAFPALLSNLDMDGSHIGVLAERAGVSRQAAGQLLREIERCGYAELAASPHDSRATIVQFTPRGRRLLATVLELVEEIESEFAAMLKPGELDRARTALLEVANRIDPGGALGEGDLRKAQVRSQKSEVRLRRKKRV